MSQVWPTYDNARWYDPTLGRFVQADTVVPGGVQGYDRYAYVDNNPVLNSDPSGHCINLVECAVEIANATTFLIQRAISNGSLQDQDFVDAADSAAPAVASGSKESASGYVSAFVSGTAANTLITTADGKAQLFNETGYGAALPGAGVALTHGAVYGLDSKTGGQTVYDPLRYAGKAVQGNLSIPIPQCDFACGPYLEGYKSSTNAVWGVDVGAEAGIGPTILGTAITNAQPTDKILGFIPGKIANRQLNGPELLGCRLMSMCGAK